MNFQNPEQNRQLAAEYVLGTMRGAARCRFRRAIEGNEGLRWEVDFWEQRLGDFARTLTPVAPPANSRLALQDALSNRHGQPLTVTPHAAQVPSRRRPMPSRRMIAGLGLAASLLLAFVVGRHYPQTAAEPSQNASLAMASDSRAHWAPSARGHAGVASALPMYVASMRMPTSSMQWLISLSPNRRHLSVVAADDYLQIGRATLELWWLSPDRGPVALGVLPVTRDATTLIPIPEELAQQSQVSFSISVEPQGGSPNGQPSRAMVDSRSDLAI